MGLQLRQAQLWIAGEGLVSYEFLAAFVQPHHPVIAPLVSEAADILEKATGRSSLDGYTEGAERVERQLDDIPGSAWRQRPARRRFHGGVPAHELRGFGKLSVTTPGIKTMQQLADAEGIDVDCLGGRPRTVSESFAGPLAEAALERMNFDRVFLSADAVTAEDGICEADHAQTRLKELMARRGREV